MYGYLHDEYDRRLPSFPTFFRITYQGRTNYNLWAAPTFYYPPDEFVYYCSFISAYTNSKK